MIWFIHHVSNNYKTSTSTASFIRRPVERREGNWNFNLITILIIWSADPSWGVNLWLWGCRGWNTWTMIPAQWMSCTQRFRQGSRQRGQAHSKKFHYIRYIIFHGCKLISNSFCLFLRLQILADRLVDRFSTTGLMQQEYSRVKLHLTVMNTLMRRDPTSIPGERPPEGKRGYKERESFDAMNVMKVSFRECLK